MHYWRITKYNPFLRTKEGFYCQKEWTSVTDVGKYFRGKLLTLDDYLQVEQAYIEAAMVFVVESHNKTFRINSLEKSKNMQKDIPMPMNEQQKTFCIELSENKEVSVGELPILISMILREYLWCKINNDEMFLHFGYDYYMYLGSVHSLDQKKKAEIESKGLFVEKFCSPY